MPDAVPDIKIPAQFAVAAVSRHPRLGIDYDSRTHTFKDSYLHPKSYGIAITDFPGKKLVKAADRDISGSGSNPMSTVSWWMLNDCLDVAGWSYVVKGEPYGDLGTVVRPFSIQHFKGLPTPVGQFADEGPGNAWNWVAEVPGPGKYTVEVTRVHRNPKKNSARTHVLEINDFLVASIGDSMASGEGNPDIPGKPEAFDPDISWWDILIVPLGVYKLTKAAVDWSWNKLKSTFTTLTAAAEGSIDMSPAPVWLEPQAHRSLLGGHSRAARMLEDRTAGRLITYLPLGRSGAGVDDGLIGPRGNGDAWIGGRGQIQELKDIVGNRQIEALLIYIGANEIGVGDNLGSIANDFRKSDTSNRHQVEQVVADHLATIPARFAELDTALASLNIRHVYLTEYPESVFNDANDTPAQACGIFSSHFDVDITPRDAQTINKAMADLNTAIQNEVAQRANKGWFYIGGIANDFRRHGYCTGKSYFVFAEESLAQQGDTTGTIHPNREGSEKIAARVHHDVETNTISSARTPGSAPNNAGQAPAPQAPVPAPAGGS